MILADHSGNEGGLFVIDYRDCLDQSMSGDLILIMHTSYWDSDCQALQRIEMMANHVAIGSTIGLTSVSLGII